MHGEGIHHLAFEVPDLDDHVSLLESKGGTRALGQPGGTHAMVDLMAGFGLYFELTETPRPLGTPGPPATRGIKDPARIGLMLSDNDAFRERYIDLFGVPVNPAIETAGGRGCSSRTTTRAILRPRIEKSTCRSTIGGSISFSRLGERVPGAT